MNNVRLLKPWDDKVSGTECEVKCEGTVEDLIRKGIAQRISVVKKPASKPFVRKPVTDKDDG